VTRSSIPDVSNLLRAWRGGDDSALEKLMPRVHDELHRLAHIYMRTERADHTLQTTALVNEAFIRLVDTREVDWRDRAHFFAISSKLMRRILVDFARKRHFQKGSGNLQRVSLDEALVISPQPQMDLNKLDDALTALSEFDARKAKVVEMRFFGGLSMDDTAEVLGVSVETVKRDWRLAKVWLLKELRDHTNET
jgi:RNA polymerase sigma-70 factor (ECF subfamily)